VILKRRMRAGVDSGENRRKVEEIGNSRNNQHGGELTGRGKKQVWKWARVKDKRQHVHNREATLGGDVMRKPSNPRFHGGKGGGGQKGKRKGMSAGGGV